MSEAESPAATPPAWKTFLTSEHVEVTVRITLSCFLGYTLSLIEAPILNANTRLLLATLAPFVGLVMPTLMFTYGGIILPMIMLFVIAYAIATALLAAAVSGGDGAFVALFTIFIFWMSFLRWDKDTGPGSSILIIAVIFTTCLGFPNFKTVQDGFNVVIKTIDGSDAVDSVSTTYLPRNSNFEYLSNHFKDIFLEWFSDRNEDEKSFVIPTGSLAGITVELVKIGFVGDDQYAIFYVPGGMWLVQAMWTETGVENPLAVFYNMFVLVGWLFLCLAVIYFIPPFRTMRFALSKGMIPAALSDASAYIELHSNVINNKELENNKNNNDRENASEQKMELRGKLVRHANVLFGGNLAKLTAFEPRLTHFRFSSPVCTWIRLKAVSDSALKCVLVAIGIEELLTENDNEQFKELSNYHVQSTASLKSCALALQAGKDSLVKDVAEEKAILHDPFRMHVHTKATVESTKSYLMALEGKRASDQLEEIKCFSQTTKNEIWLMLRPIYLVFTAFIKGLINVLWTFFKISYWKKLCVSPYSDLSKMIWCIKYTAGFLTLTLMTLYWDDFNQNFSITISLSRETHGQVFAAINGGWTLVAYTFATTQSIEGSIKKGILRMVGTVAGGFFGWLALVACEDSRFESGFNPFGLVAWLTITTAIAVYSATNRGFYARLGLSGDYSFGPVYFVITEVIVIFYCELSFGPEGRHDVAINRTISNLVGIAIAMLFAVIPPSVWGGNPAHCREIVEGIEDRAGEYLNILLQSSTIDDASFETTSTDLMTKKDLDLAAGIRLHELSKDFLNDASRLSKVPLLRTDTGALSLELALIARDVYTVSFVGILASRILLKESVRRLALEDDAIRAKLESYAKMFENRKSRYILPEDNDQLSPVLGVDLEEGDDDETKEAKLLVELFLRLLRMIQQRVKAHHNALDGIKWGYTFSVTLPKEVVETSTAN